MKERTMTDPISEHGLHLAAPIERWDEAIPLGNGMMGVLLWGDNNVIKLSLDRGDLWDVRRPAPFDRPEWTWKTLKSLVAQKDRQSLVTLFERPYKDFPYPTKIPAGRIELVFDDSVVAEKFSLRLHEAVGKVRMGKCNLSVFCSATSPVGMIEIRGAEPRLKIRPPAFEQEAPAQEEWGSTGSLGRLRYPAAQHGGSGHLVWTRQDCAGSMQYAIVAATRKTSDGCQIAFTVATSKDGSDPVEIGQRQVTEALEAGYDSVCRSHTAWWDKFWSQSAITIPDARIEQHYYQVRYFYGAASRRGAPPIPLQGVWTADEGRLPPWKGDYHHDLNTQLTYWPYLAANHLDEGLCLLDFIWALLPQFQDFAQRFYAATGACIPTVMTLDGKLMGGWSPFAYSPTNGIWVSHAFYRHWRYTMDRVFLEERAYPFCQEIARFIESLLLPGPRGTLQLPLSSSPELHNNELSAWCTPNTNYDLSLMRWLFGALDEMALVLGDVSAASHWQDLLARLDDLAVADTGSDGAAKPGMGGLKIAPDEHLTQSHRHLSHLMAIYPLGLLQAHRSERDRSVIDESIRHLDSLGMQAWCGYTFCWTACVAARGGQAARALNMLELFLKGFVSRNGFHLNGDFKGLGLTSAQNRPFTLEGNFAFAEAVHELLLRSSDGMIHLFPSTPAEWLDAEFHDLRTEGAFRVSARRRNGKTTWMRIKAETNGVLRLLDPFGEASPVWNRRDVIRTNAIITCNVQANEIVEATLESRPT